MNKHLDKIIFIFSPQRPGKRRALQTLAWGVLGEPIPTKKRGSADVDDVSF